MVFRVLTFLLLLPALALADADLDAEVLSCAREDWEKSPIHELTWVGEAINKYVMKDRKVPTYTEYDRKFILNNPGSVMVLRNDTCHALAFSYALCGLDPDDDKTLMLSQDEETDAARHWYFSTALACSRGTDFARTYLIAHELDPKDWAAREHMDIHNNYVGLAWAADKGNCMRELTDERMARTFVRYLKEGRFKTIEPGKTRCARPDEIQDFAELGDKVSEMWPKLAKLYPNLCGKLPMPWGLKEKTARDREKEAAASKKAIEAKQKAVKKTTLPPEEAWR